MKKKRGGRRREEEEEENSRYEPPLNIETRFATGWASSTTRNFTGCGLQVCLVFQIAQVRCHAARFCHQMLYYISCFKFSTN